MYLVPSQVKLFSEIISLKIEPEVFIDFRRTERWKRRKLSLLLVRHLALGVRLHCYLVKKGWFGGIFDVNEEGLKFLQNDIDEANCFSKFMDVTDAKSVQTAVENFTETTEVQLNVIFNNAGVI